MESVKKYVKSYEAFRGVDYSASPAVISDEHASDMLNMFVGDDGIMQKRPGWHILRTFENVNEFSDSVTYNPGDYVVHEGIKHRCIAEHTGAWNADHFSKNFSSSTSYSVGDYCRRDENIYLCVNAHTGAWVNADFTLANPVRLPINGLHYVQYRPGMGMLFIHAGERLYGTMFRPHDVGDVNESGSVTASDAATILRYLAGAEDLTPLQKLKADWDNDGVITEKDAAGILRYVVGLESFPDGYNGVLSNGYFRVTKQDGSEFTLANGRSVSFESGGYLYILDGHKYYRIVDTQKTATTPSPLGGDAIVIDYVSAIYGEEVPGYIPTTGIIGHYEYKEPKSEMKQGATIVAKQTVTAVAESDDGKATFVGLTPFLDKIKVSITLNNSQLICQGAEIDVRQQTASIAGMTIRYVSGSVTVEGLTAGDTIKMSIVEGENDEITVVTEATKTAAAVSNVAKAEIAAVREFASLMEVTLSVNGSAICTSEEFASSDQTVAVGIYTLKQANGVVTVDNLTTGTKVTLFMKEPDEEVDSISAPGGEGNEGEWKKPEPHEARNLLQTKQINTFLADGIHKAYYLTENNCIVNKVEQYVKTRCISTYGIEDFKATESYAVGDYVKKDGKYYKCKTAHSGAWNAAHFQEMQSIGTDIPTKDNIDHVDSGTYNGVYYYYKYVWIEINATSEFATFSTSTAYAVGALVKYSGKYYKCIAAHSAGAWNADHFDEVNAYTASDASSATPIQNKISYTTKILFATTPAADNDNAENIRVTFSPRKHSSTAAIEKDRGYIEKCTIYGKYGYFNDNRFFLSGNPEHRNWDFMSGVDDPTYFPNDGWTKIGSDLTAIQGYLHYGSDMAIIKEDNEQDATVYMRSVTLANDSDVLFPVKQGAQGVGAIAKGTFATLRDEPLFLAKEGVYAIEGTDASQERNVPNRSFFIDPVLKNDIEQHCIAITWGNYYVLCNPVTGRCYVADGRYHNYSVGTKYGKTLQYEWYVWDNVPAQCFCVVGDRLFFGTDDGRLNVFNTDWDGPKRFADGAEFVDGSTVLHKWNPYDGGWPINAYYVTKRDNLGTVDYKKTMLNDGGVIELVPQEKSSVSITVKTEKGEWFVDDIQTDSDEPSVVIPIRHRVKNFDSIETRIENNKMHEGLAIIGLQYRYAVTTNRR